MNAAWQRRAHAIWARKGWASALLLPLAWLYGAVLWLRRKRYASLTRRSKPFARPPIAVAGNLVVGGTGKTPAVIALAQALGAEGWHPGIVSRGYGARLGALARTGQGELPASAFGDEPALIAAATGCPIAVHPKRMLALQALLRDYPQVDVVIADDGMQHLALPRDLTIVVQDARGLGNGRLLPAGPLREPASRMREAHTVITNLTASLTSEPDSGAALAPKARQAVMRLAPASLTRLADGLRMDWDAWKQAYADKPLAALAAIGQPERFFAMLRQHGLTLTCTIGLADHETPAAGVLNAIEAQVILVTEKDAVKLAGSADGRLWSVHAPARFEPADWAHGISEALKATRIG